MLNPTDYKKKVLLIGPLPPPLGGTRVSFSQLVSELERREDIDTEVLSMPSETGNAVYDLITYGFLLFRLVWLIASVDVVTLHATTRGVLVMGPIVWFLCRLFQKRSVLRKFGGIFDKKFESLPRVFNLFIKHTVLNMDLLLFQTKHLVSCFRDLVPESRVEWFPNSRPLPSTISFPPSRPEEVRRFVFVGHVKRTKGVLEIVRACRQIGSNITVDIYGPLNEDVDESMFREGQVEYRGVLSPERVIATLMTYDVLLLPTYHSGEGYPGVILEAYSAGIPVIATKWNAIPEIVDETSGILVEPKNVDALREAMLYLIHAPEEYKRLCKGAREKALRFSSKVWVDRFVEFVSNLDREGGG